MMVWFPDIPVEGKANQNDAIKCVKWWQLPGAMQFFFAVLQRCESMELVGSHIPWRLIDGWMYLETPGDERHIMS